MSRDTENVILRNMLIRFIHQLRHSRKRSASGIFLYEGFRTSRNDSSPKITKAGLFLTSCLLILHLLGPAAFAVSTAPVAVEAIQVTPEATMPGTYPDITASVRMKPADRPTESLQINIVAALIRPDHVMKSWQWKKVSIAPGEVKSFTLPKEYDIRLIGAYKIEFVIYSSDMQRRFSALSRKLIVSDQPQPSMRNVPQQEQAGPPATTAGQKQRRIQERSYLGMGVYANALNPAGGATILVWPFKNVGLQASYTLGTFTSYEGRLLAKLELSSGFNPYLGAGYLHVSKTSNVIGVSTTFTDSAVSGVAGIEVPFGKKLRGYLEVSGAQIDLKKIVSNGSQTVSATVDYSPVSIGGGLVYSLF